MATVARAAEREIPEPAEARDDGAPACYDRSSLSGDYMVMLADQTPEDFENFAPETQFCDYIDGISYMSSPVSDRHQEHVQFLCHLLDDYCDERKVGRTLTGPAVLRISEARKVEPDIFIQTIATANRRESRPILVVEVLSPSTRTHDVGLKLSVYHDAEIPEIWIIDDRDKALVVERRDERGYERERFSSGRLDSAAIPGLWIDVAWLWEDPLPSRRHCSALIAGSPSP